MSRKSSPAAKRLLTEARRVSDPKDATADEAVVSVGKLHWAMPADLAALVNAEIATQSKDSQGMMSEDEARRLYFGALAALQ